MNRDGYRRSIDRHLIYDNRRVKTGFKREKVQDREMAERDTEGAEREREGERERERERERGRERE